MVSVQSREHYADEQRRLNVPWTTRDYEMLRTTAQALVRTHRSHDLLDGKTISVVDGPAFWSLLGALDRTLIHRED